MKISSSQLEETKQNLSNKIPYYASLFEKCLTYFSIQTSFLILNYFYPTITNKNNRNWNEEEREEKIGTLTSSFYIGCIIGALISGIFIGFNTKTIYNVFKFLLALTMIPFVLWDYKIMIISRFLQGVIGEVVHVTLMWSVYEIALPKHKTFIYPMLYVSAGLCGLIYSKVSEYDNGDDKFWKIAFLSPVVLLCLSIVLDYVFATRVNTFTYLLKKKGKEFTFNQIRSYYDDVTSKYLIRKYDLEFELQIFDEDNQENESIFYPLKRFFKAVVKFRQEVFHLFICSVSVMLCYSEAYSEFSLYFGSKSMENLEEVEASKETVIIYSIGQIIVLFLVGLTGVLKKRKTVVIVSLVSGQIALGVISFGYFTHQLKYARIGVILGSIGGSIIYPTIYLYANDVCPPSVFAITGLTKRLMGSVFGFVFPWYLKFETSSYEEIGYKLLIFIGIGIIGVIVISIIMFESSGMKKSQIYESLRGIEGTEGEGEELIGKK